MLDSFNCECIIMLPYSTPIYVSEFYDLIKDNVQTRLLNAQLHPSITGNTQQIYHLCLSIFVMSTISIENIIPVHHKKLS